MNHPDVYDKFVVPAHLTKVSHQPDTKISNAATFEVQREDHTVGDPLVMQLLEDGNVSFAAYKIPHPMEHRLQVKVRTNGTVTPVQAYNAALNSLRTELMDIKEQFRRQVEDAMSTQPTHPNFDPHEQFETLDGGAYDAYGDGNRQYDNAYAMHDGDMGGDYGGDMEFDGGYGAAM